MTSFMFIGGEHNVRISNHRYARDRDRYDLAYGMLQLGARPKTVSAWTQLTQYQIRIVADQYRELLTRHRGRPPKSMGWFWRDRRRQQEGTLLACLFMVLRVVPRDSREGDEAVASLTRGLRLCSVYQEYVKRIPNHRVSFEYALLLAQELARGKEVALTHCSRCGSAALIDRLSAMPQECATCKGMRLHGIRCEVELKASKGRRSPKTEQSKVRMEIMHQVVLFD